MERRLDGNGYIHSMHMYVKQRKAMCKTAVTIMAYFQRERERLIFGILIQCKRIHTLELEWREKMAIVFHLLFLKG